MTFTILWHHLPILLSILSLCAALFWPSDTDYGMFEGVILMLRLIPALMFICVVWIVAAILK